jgi:hypothetical protein
MKHDFLSQLWQEASRFKGCQLNLHELGFPLAQGILSATMSHLILWMRAHMKQYAIQPLSLLSTIG